jgi:hypothetical protein
MDKNIQLSTHFAMGEFVTASDYGGNYPSTVYIDDGLPVALEKVYSHFGCNRAEISSGYRTSACDKSVGGSGSGPHTQGIAVDVCFYRGNQPIPSRIIACYLQDIGVKGIGVYCGGTQNWTHFDMRVNSVWYGDERDYSAGHTDFYSYTGTSKTEVYGSGSAQSSTVMTTDPTVRVVQVWLNKTYGLKLATDGIYGNETRRAIVRGLQLVLNAKFGAKLETDGIFGAKTKAAVRPLQRGAYGGYPSILQAFLICRGYDTGGFDGDFGARTESAVKTFQTVKGLSVTGIADKNTFEKLAE